MKKTPLASRLAAITAGVLVFSLAGGFATPPRAHAGLPVIDIVNELKEWGTDTLAWQLGNLAIESILKSTVNWINSGFNGSPAYVTDLQENLRGVGDAVAERFFNELTTQLEAELPFQDKVLDAVRLGYYLQTSPESFYTKYPSTLNQVSPDSRAFLDGDFSQGGFNAWFATVMNPQNNPYGAQMLAEEYLSNAIGTQVQIRNRELDWGKGFLSWRGECTQERDVNDPVLLGGVDDCLAYEIKTPGSVIIEQLNKTVGEGTVSRLVSSDELNEVISALLNQLIGRVLGGEGLSGTSRPSSSGSSFLSETTSSTQSGSAASSLVTTFRTTIANQRSAIASYRAGWERIRSAAQDANAQCSGGRAATVLEQANQALAKAANAEAAIAQLEADLDAAVANGGGQSETFMNLSDEYNELFASGALVSPEEEADAETESADTGDATPGSLYSQMRAIADSSDCNSSNE